jgi:hypothetical protein
MTLWVQGVCLGPKKFIPDIDIATEGPIYSYTIITTENTPALSFLHDRMPVILDRAAALQWLPKDIGKESTTTWTAELAHLLKSNDEGLMWYPVDPRVGKAGTEDPVFLQPLPMEVKKESPTLLTLWKTSKRSRDPSPADSADSLAKKVKQEES